VQSEQGVVH
jgi:hypothetical protein